LAMTEDLFDHQAASRMALQQAQNDLAKAQSRVARTEESLRVLSIDPENVNTTGRITIAAPLAGTVIERKVTEGQFVQTDSSPIMTVADVSTVWVMGDVFERDLHLVAVASPAVVSVSAYSGETFRGRVDYISDAIDPATRTAKLRIRVPNPRSRLKPEMFASISVGVGETEHVLILPSRAAFIENGRTWVYVAVAHGRFVRRSVELGQEEGTDRRILSGLNAGDRIVVEGALLLRQEEEKRAS
jgi:membrane fusion protein, heavy metal efflux system